MALIFFGEAIYIKRKTNYYFFFTNTWLSRLLMIDLKKFLFYCKKELFPDIKINWNLKYWTQSKTHVFQVLNKFFYFNFLNLYFTISIHLYRSGWARKYHKKIFLYIKPPLQYYKQAFSIHRNIFYFFFKCCNSISQTQLEMWPGTTMYICSLKRKCLGRHAYSEWITFKCTKKEKKEKK